MVNIRVIEAGSDDSKRGYFLPLGMKKDSVEVHMGYYDELGIDYIMLDNGKIFSYQEDKFFETCFSCDTLENIEKTLPFDFQKYHYLLFTNDLTTCFGLLRGRTEGNLLIISVFQSKNSLFDSALENILCYEVPYTSLKLDSSIDKWVTFDISRNLKYFVILWADATHTWCEFVDVNKSDGKVITLKHRCQFLLDNYIESPFDLDLSDFKWPVKFDYSESFCLLDGESNAAIWSMKEQSMLTFPPTKVHAGDNESLNYTIVQDNQGEIIIFRALTLTYYYGGFESSEPIIEIFKKNLNRLEQVKSLQRNDLGIGQMASFNVYKSDVEIQGIIGSFRNVYVIDPFKEVMLFKIDFDHHFWFEYISVITNSIGCDIFIMGAVGECHTFADLINLDNLKEMSLKLLAKRSVISNFSKKELMMVNLPNSVKVILGI